MLVVCVPPPLGFRLTGIRFVLVSLHSVDTGFCLLLQLYNTSFPAQVRSNTAGLWIVRHLTVTHTDIFTSFFLVLNVPNRIGKTPRRIGLVSSTASYFRSFLVIQQTEAAVRTIAVYHQLTLKMDSGDCRFVS